MDCVKKADKQEPKKDSGDAGSVQHNLRQVLNSSSRSRTTKDLVAKTEEVVSPTKGILLTPGTNKAQRKTVSFGASQNLREDVLRGAMSANSGLSTDSKDRAHLSDSLPPPLDTHPTTAPNAAFLIGSQLFHPGHQVFERDKDLLLDTSLNCHDGDKDVTMDLQEPQSRSGQHWKRQYSRYHIRSDHEMRKLLKYTQNAKLFATKRDAEAVDLEEKLKAALAKVADMDAKVSELASQLAQSSNSLMDTEDQADLVTQLAARTTEVLRYKNKLEELEKTFRKRAAEVQSNTSENLLAPKEKTTQSSGDLEMVSSQSSSQTQNAVAHVHSLEQENAALKKTILRVKEEMKQYEVRHKARRDEWKRSADRSKARRANLKDQLKQQQASYDHTLGKLKAAYTKEIDELRQQLQALQALQAVADGESRSAFTSRLGKGATELRDERSSEDEEVLKADEFHPQYRHHEPSQTRRGPKTSEGESLRAETSLIRLPDKPQTDALTRPGQHKMLSIETKDRAQQTSRSREHARGSGQGQRSLYNQVTSDQASRISLPSTRKLGPTCAILNEHSSHAVDDGDLVLSNGKTLPLDRFAAAKLRLEKRLALKQESHALGKENVRPSRV